MTVPTPEHDKLTAALKEPRGGVLADFIDYLGSIGVRFGKYPEVCTDENCIDEDDKGYNHVKSHGDYYHSDPDSLLPVGGETTFSKWIAGFYGVDYKAFQAEKEAIYQEISRAANAKG